MDNHVSWRRRVSTTLGMAERWRISGMYMREKLDTLLEEVKQIQLEMEEQNEIEEVQIFLEGNLLNGQEDDWEEQLETG